jgi:hypothetical protein
MHLPVRRTASAWSVFAAITVYLVGAASASATSIAITATPNPAKAGETITLTNTGATSTVEPEPSTLIYDYWEPGTRACASTAANERNDSGGNASVTSIEQKFSPSFNDQTTFIPKPKVTAYRVCAYIYTGGDDSVAPEAVATTIVNIAPTRAELLAKAVTKCHKIHKKSRRKKCLKTAKKLYG